MRVPRGEWAAAPTARGPVRRRSGMGSSRPRDLQPAMRQLRQRPRSPAIAPRNKRTVLRHHAAEPMPAVDRRTAGSLAKLARECQAPLATAVLAALAVSIHGASKAPRVVVGFHVAGRKHAATQAIIGYFAETLPVSFDFTHPASFRDLVVAAQQALAHLARNDITMAALVTRDLEPNPWHGASAHVFAMTYHPAGHGLPRERCCRRGHPGEPYPFQRSSISST